MEAFKNVAIAYYQEVAHLVQTCINITFRWLLRTFASLISQASALTPEVISMKPARKSGNLLGYCTCYFDFSEKVRAPQCFLVL